MNQAVKVLFDAFVNNKAADQSVHPHSLISSFVVLRLGIIIPTVEISTIYRP